MVGPGMQDGFAVFEFAGGQVPVAVCVAGALPLGQKHIIAPDQDEQCIYD
jgi:hypothetical protein